MTNSVKIRRKTASLNRDGGFSLVEMAVVLVLAGILLTMGMGSWTAYIKNATAKATKDREATIRDALVSHLRRKGRLPCPDIVAPPYDGNENRATAGDPTTNCAQATGIVPFVDLGLSRDDVLDGWGNFISYRVSNNAATTPLQDWVRNANFRVGNTGMYSVSDRVTTPVTAVAVLISHGPNGDGAWTVKSTQLTPPSAGTDEAANANGSCNVATPCYNRDATDSGTAPGGVFDDIVLPITADQLLTPLITAGDLRSPETDFRKQCDDAKDRLLSSALANRSGPPGPVKYTVQVGVATLKDPWGSNAPSSQPAAQVQITSSSTGIVASWTSSGPDGVAGGGDDVSCVVTHEDLSAVLARTGF